MRACDARHEPIPFMNKIDLVRELDSALSASMRERLSRELGLSTDAIGHVVTGAASVLVAALMAAGATSRGASEVWASVMAEANDARIAERLSDRLGTTAGLRSLEVTGQMFASACFSTSMSELSDCVADHVGIPAQPACALTAVIAAVLAGLVKCHLLIEQAKPADLTQLLANQWPFVEPYMTDRQAVALRQDGAAAFRDAIPDQLRVLAGNQHRESASQPAATTAADAEGPERSTAALMDDRAGRATLRWLVAFACLVTVAGVAAIALVLVYLQTHPAFRHTVATAVTAMHRINLGQHR